MSANLLARALTGTQADHPFCDAALVQAMLRFEAALARAQGRLGIIPQPAAQSIAASAETAALDPDALVRDAVEAGALAIPLVAALTAQVRAADSQAAAYVHFGATSQDVLDTAVVLCAKNASAALEASLLAASRAGCDLARAHAAVPALARTLLQPAGVTSLGLRFAQWAHALAQARQRLLATGRTALRVSLGGALGNLAAWGDQGAALRAEVARELGLHDPGVTWHTLRAPWLALACDAALAAGTMSKIAHDVALGCMAEIGELREPPAAGRGSSSAMPHKRNPVLSMRVIAAVQPVPHLLAAVLGAMQQEQERALGGWQAELGLVPDLLTRTCAAAQALHALLEGLQADAQRCRSNIEALHGTVFSEALAALLIPALGRADAQALVAGLCGQVLARCVPLRSLLDATPDPRLTALSSAQLDAVFDPDRAALPSMRLVAPLLEQTLALHQP
jgi:3-carboxy-cis,cis-muconate cycloisomerase